MNEPITLTAGMDLGDRYSQVFVLDDKMETVAELRVRTTPDDIERVLGQWKRMRIALEVGTHSPWVSRLLAKLGHEVLVANARKLRMIYGSERKSDRTDAEMLARIARLDPTLLAPIRHRGEESQFGLTLIRARDGLVRARSSLVSMVRGQVKSQGARLRRVATERFHALGDELPESVSDALVPVMVAIESLTREIRWYDRQIEAIGSAWPEVVRLQQVSGVGPVTTLAFVLSVEDPKRFQTSRDVPAYLGLCPRRAQSGEQDPQLRISKTGDPYLRRLLVGSAHYILGPHGPDCDLRRWGLALAARGGKSAKKRAAVAVARKLAVVLHALWRRESDYEPIRPAPRRRRRPTPVGATR